jgi:hypothetical protein
MGTRTFTPHGAERIQMLCVAASRALAHLAMLGDSASKLAFHFLYHFSMLDPVFSTAEALPSIRSSFDAMAVSPYGVQQLVLHPFEFVRGEIDREHHALLAAF